MMRVNREIDARVPRVEDPPARDAPGHAGPRPWALAYDSRWPHVRVRPLAQPRQNRYGMPCRRVPAGHACLLRL